MAARETAAAMISRLEGKVDTLVEAVAEMRGVLLTRVDKHEEQIQDHEKRLRVIESDNDRNRGERDYRRWLIPLVLVNTTGVIGAIATLVWLSTGS